MTLDELALKYGTDKSSKGHNYMPYYEIFFQHLPKSTNLLEIGVDKGDSVLMWREYFPDGEIHGIDIRGDYEYLHEKGIHTHIVDQSSEAELKVFGSKYDGFFDVIACDGSHECDDDILTFNTLFPYLKPGGLYVWEDLLCSYDKSRWGKNADSYDRIRQMVGEVGMNGLVDNNRICANKFDAIERYSGTYFENHIKFVFKSMGLCIIKKILH